jgi:hypothetical protein
LNENTIHNQLKTAFSKAGDMIEQEIDGYVIDIVRKKTLIEIQTKNFLKMKPKIKKLLKKYKLKLVHNIPSIKWLVTVDEENNIITKRKSTKKGSFYHIFDELIYLTDIVCEPKFSLEILLTEEEEIRTNDGKGSWRRKGVSIKDRNLISIIETKKMNKIDDYMKILPPEIKEPFSTKDISKELKIKVVLARKVVYFLKKIEVIRCTGKSGNLLLYKRKKVKSKK